MGAVDLGLVVAIPAVFGIVQWRSAEDAQADAEEAQGQAEVQRRAAEFATSEVERGRDELGRLLTSSDLAAESARELAKGDPELALALAVQGLREIAVVTDTTPDSNLDAALFALQEMGVQFDVVAGTPVAVRTGPSGPTGVFVLSPAQIVALAEAVTDRRLRDDECSRFSGGACPEPVEFDIGTRGYGQFAGATSPGPGTLAGTTVTVAAASLREEPGRKRAASDSTPPTSCRARSADGSTTRRPKARATPA